MDMGLCDMHCTCRKVNRVAAHWIVYWMGNKLRTGWATTPVSLCAGCSVRCGARVQTCLGVAADLSADVRQVGQRLGSLHIDLQACAGYAPVRTVVEMCTAAAEFKASSQAADGSGIGLWDVLDGPNDPWSPDSSRALSGFGSTVSNRVLVCII
jgi:hypothetical protein